jgi:predicted peptidase
MLTLLVAASLPLAAAQAPVPAAAQAGRGGAAPPPEPSPTAPLYRHTGEQYRIYNFPGTGESIPYRLFVPTSWTPDKKLPIVVTPMGYRGLAQPYYGSRYPIARVPPSVPAAGWTPQEDERAEQDVMYVMDLVTKEYNVDTTRVYIHGQNPSGSGALHLVAKYTDRFAAAVISSGPIVLDNYPFASLKGRVAMMVIHGDQDTNNPIEASQKMAAAAKAAGVDTVYATVPGGTHLEAYLTYASQIFDFLDKHRK